MTIKQNQSRFLRLTVLFGLEIGLQWLINQYSGTAKPPASFAPPLPPSPVLDRFDIALTVPHPVERPKIPDALSPSLSYSVMIA